MSLFSLPVLLLFLSYSLLGFLERLLVSHYASSAVEALVYAVYVIRIFQIPCLALTTMGQAFVGYYYGAKEWDAIGKCTWQLIWFSIFSMSITFPMSYLAKKWFFQTSDVSQEVLPYFFILSVANFLFPLGGALASFYLGMRKVRFVFFTTLGSYLLNAGLDLALIFGIGSWIPPLGLKGAAIATSISQGILCLVLGIGFFRQSNRMNYGTACWAFDPKAFFRYVTPAFPRSLSRISLLLIWAASAQILASMGEAYLFVLSITGIVSLFLSFIAEGTHHILVVLISNALGAKRYADIGKFLRNSYVVLSIVALILAVPLIIFPESVLALFSLGERYQGWIKEQLHWGLFGVWVHTVTLVFNSILASVLIAQKDTLFILALSLFSWVTSYLPVYFGMCHFHLSPDKFWLLFSCGFVVSSILHLYRIFQKKWLQRDAYFHEWNPSS